MAPEFSVRSDAVDVEQIMKQIRQRIREKRGVDYTEEEIRELANVKLEKFLDPSRVRSELLTYYRQATSAPTGSIIPQAPPNYAFEDEMPYASSPGLGGRTIRLIRKILNPVLKFFINPNPFIHVLNMQGQINAQNTRRIDHLLVAEQLNFEIIHNLVVEMTRLAVEVKNLKMRAESLQGRLDFAERRARALESVVQYKPGAGAHAEAPRSQGPQGQSGSSAGQPTREGQGPRDGEGQGGVIKGEAQRNRRRRRRRGRGGAGGGAQGGAPDQGAPQGAAGQADGPEEGGDDLNFDEPVQRDEPRGETGSPEPSPAFPAAGPDEPADQ